MKKFLIVLTLIFILGCTNNMKIENNYQVSLEYTGTLSDGTVFDSNVGKNPLTFIAGAGQMIKGFDNAVIGMSLNEEKTFSIPPSQAYGELREDLIQEISVEQLTNMINQQPQVGMALTTAQGHTGRITRIDEDLATIDFNHELAGKELTFNIKILDIQKP